MSAPVSTMQSYNQSSAWQSSKPLPEIPTNQNRPGVAVKSSSVWMDFRYLFSPLGLIKAWQIVLGILMCACISRGLCYFTCTGTAYTAIGAGGQHYVLLVATVCILATAFFLILHFSHSAQGISQLHELNVNWLVIELIYSGLSVFFYFIAFCVEAAYANGHRMFADYDHSAWIAAAIFCFFNWCLYIGSVVLLCREVGIAFNIIYTKSPVQSTISTPSPLPPLSSPIPPLSRSSPVSLTVQSLPVLSQHQVTNELTYQNQELTVDTSTPPLDESPPAYYRHPSPPIPPHSTVV